MSFRRPLSEDRFTSNWEGRCWLDWGAVEVDTHKLKEAGGFKVLSYHIYADRKCTTIRYSSTKTWTTRKTTLLEEIKSYDADIICLQDVDHYNDWWQPQLMFLGYDSLWKQRTSATYDHAEGVVIAYRRELFQLFKTINVEFNRAGEHESANVRRSCITDDVGIIAFLQPWIPNFLNSAICVCCAMFYDGEYTPGGLDIRCLQAIYLSKCIEYENRNFHLPVLIGISMHDEPDSAAYHVLRAGRKQLMPHVPQRCPRPTVKPFSRASVEVYWEAAAVTEADPPVLQYVISWRPGGNLDMGFCLSKKVDSGDSIRYTTTINAAGIRTTVAQELRCALIHGLSAETPFEFRVAAVNAVGQGEWSEASFPICLENPSNAPSKGPLNKLRDLTGVRELRECTEMEHSDFNVQKAARVDINDPLTCLTPRTMDGHPDYQISKARVLPASTNPREGWRPRLKGEMSQELQEEIWNTKRLRKSVIMEQTGEYTASVSDTASNKIAVYDLDKAGRKDEPDCNTLNASTSFDESHADPTKSVTSPESKSQSRSNNHSIEYDPSWDDDDDTFKFQCEESAASRDDGASAVDTDSYSDDISGIKSTVQGSTTNLAGTTFSSADNVLNDLNLNDATLTTMNEESSWEMQSSKTHHLGANKSAILGDDGKLLNAGGVRARTMNDDVILDLKEVIETVGKPNRRQIHSLNLRSVYEAYGLAGEPLYTVSNPDAKGSRGVCCMDYIFFSGASLRPSKVLSIPLLTKLSGDDPSQSLTTPDPYLRVPPPSFRDIFDRGHKELPLPGKTGILASRASIEQMKSKVAAILASETTDSRSIWGGKWVPFSAQNLKRFHSWLPNDSFSSSHIALCAHFQINEDYACTEWR